MSTASEDFQPVKSADRTLDVLEALASSREHRPLGELARQLGIPKSSLHGILRTMEQRRWVVADPSGRFGLGVRALLVGMTYVETDPVVQQLAPVLDWLADQTGETVHLGRLDGDDVVYMAKRESSHPLRMFSSVGRRLPAHATALGKSILAERVDELSSLITWPLKALTPNTITDRDALLADLAAVRKRGCALDREENALGIRCFAVVTNGHGPPVDAVSVSVPVSRLDARNTKRITQLVLEARRRAAALLSSSF